MERIQLTSNIRTETGKGVARKLRQKGLIPAILYGSARESVALTVNTHELHQMIAKGFGDNNLIELQVQDNDKSDTVSVLLKDYQIDPVRRELLHADFLEVEKGHSIEIDVPFELQGEAPGVKAGGILEFTTREVSIRCLPKDMLNHIDVDISTLEIGDSVSISDLNLDEKYQILSAPETFIVTVAHPMREEELESETGEGSAVEPEIIQKGKKAEEEE